MRWSWMGWITVFVAVWLSDDRAVLAQPAVDRNLTARWTFTKDTHADDGFAADVGNQTAKVIGPVKFGEEHPWALQLSGDSKAKHRVIASQSVPESLRPPQDMTVEAWAKIDQPLEWGGLAGFIQDNGSYERGWLLGYRHSQFSFAIAAQKPGKLTYLTSRTRFSPGYWYHIVGTYDGKMQRLYVDGELAAKSEEQQGVIAYPPKGEFVIGAYHDDNENYTTQGEIEQVSVWKRALSAEEITTRFKSRSNRFPEIVPVRPKVTDWPTYNRDNQRTGMSPDELPLPLSLAWEYQLPHPPTPAWPPPAKQDFWHHKTNLSPRVVYDRANHVVAVGGRVFVGSSSDDTVRCLDAKTGTLLWTFTAEGPVRLAPTIAGSRVLFGSDDGFAYCLDATDGKLQWKVRLGPTDRKIPGNQRLISVWPMRSSVLAEEGIAYFCAGLFPKQGVYQGVVEIASGKLLAKGKIEQSAQGYLERRAGRLHVPTGRDPAGAFVSDLKRKGKDVSKEVRQIPEEYPYGFIGAGDLRFGGGDNRVAAFAVKTGEKVWEAEVAGKAWSLAVAGGQLLVSTHQGRLYAFAPGKQAGMIHRPMPEPIPQDSETDELITDLVEQTALSKGYGLILAKNPVPLAMSCIHQTELKMIVVATDSESAAGWRKTIAKHGLAPRITVHVIADTDSLPYTDYVFNLVLADRETPFSEGELERVLRPHGGVIVWDRDLTTMESRGPLADVGEWSHMYADPANTVCSGDQHVGSAMQLQWFGPPGPRQMLDRHLRTVAPLWKNGRMFIPGNNRVIAVDAYNGTPLWNVEVPNSRRVGAYRDCSYIVAGEDSVYVAAENVCLRLDAATGKTLGTFPAANIAAPLSKTTALPAVADRPVEWGYIAIAEETLVGTAAAPGASRRESSLVAIREGTFWDARPLVTSEGVFGLAPQTGHLKWTYQPQGAVINSTMTIADGKVMFLESQNPKTLKNRPGRVKPAELFQYGAHVVALDLATGKPLWKTPQNLHAIEHNVFGASAGGKLVIVGSRNNGTDRKASRVFYDIHTFDTATGKPGWFRTQNQGTKIDGDHGEQDHHPVIVGDRLYCEPFAYHLNDGKPLLDWKWNPKHRRGCGTISASAKTFFFRESNPTLFDLENNTYDKVTTSTRPGCWINMIPAGGLLLIPEASSGCTCNYPIQTSLAFLPIRPSKVPHGQDDR